MDRIYSDITEEKDDTDGTNKKRISSILKAPRTPLSDLSNRNELIQDNNIEKRQRNSRRVSFAENIRVFPHDPQVLVESNSAESSSEPRNQNVINENQKPEAAKSEITGMNTLLHAPIQALQQMECLDANASEELNKMERTLIFSEQNEMDMTTGHTIIITHNTGIYKDTDKPKKKDFDSFLSEIKLGGKASQVAETSFFNSAIKINENSLSQQKTNTENIKKINFGEFLESLKSTKGPSALCADTIPSAVSEGNMYSSEQNKHSHLQGKNCNVTTLFGGFGNRQHCETSALSNEKANLSASKQSGCGESMDVTTVNTEMLLSSETSTLNSKNQQQDLSKVYPVTYSTDSHTSKTSSYQLGIQQKTSMSTNEINPNNKEADVNDKHAIKITSRDASQSQINYVTNTVSMPLGTVISVPVLRGDKTTTFSSFSADMEMTRHSLGFIWEVNSKGTDRAVHGVVKKQRNDISKLMDKTDFREIDMDVTKNHVSMNSCLTSIQNPNSKTSVANEEDPYNNMELLNSRTNPNAERQGNTLLSLLPNGQSTTFSVKNINLNTSQFPKSFKKQGENPYQTDTSNIIPWTNSTKRDSKIHGKVGFSNNAISLTPGDDIETLISSENMEITKPAAYLLHNSLDPVGFQEVWQQVTGADKKNVTDCKSNMIMVLPLSENNEMEITKSYTVPVNYNMQQCERTIHMCSLEPANKTIYMYNDMDETKPTTCTIGQPVENSDAQVVQKQSNASGEKFRSPKDRTFVFSLNDENEMDITRSHTVALNHDVIITSENMPVPSIVPSDKAVLSALNDVEINKSVVCETDHSLRNVTNFLTVPKQNAETIRSDSDKPATFALSEGSETELMKNLTWAGEAAPQVQTLASKENANTSGLNNNNAGTESMFFAPANKTMVLVHNNDMEIKKPISNGFEALQLENKKNGKLIQVKSTKEETYRCLLDEGNEMEITRSHTVAVNHDIAQQVMAMPKKLSSAPADKTDMYETTKCTAFVPAGKSTIILNNDMEITKSISPVNLINTLKSLPQKRNGNCKAALADPDNTSVFAQHVNEIEIIKCHTVLVSHDNISQCERTPQVFVQNNIDTTGFQTVKKDAEANFCNNKSKPEKNTEWESSLSQMGNEPVNTSINVVAFDNKALEYHQAASQTKSIFPFSESRVFTSYQHGSEITDMPSDTVSRGNLQKFEKEKMPDKVREQNNSDVLSDEKQILDTSKVLKDKTIAFSDGESIEMSSNYTTATERRYKNNRNEYDLHSHAKSNSEFSASGNACENKLNIKKNTPEKAICLGNVYLDIVQEQQNCLEVQESQLDSCTAEVNNHMKGTASNVALKKENEYIFSIERSFLNPILSEETVFDLNTENICLKDDPKKLSQSRQIDNIVMKATDPIDNKIGTKHEWGNFTKDWQNDLESIPLNMLLPEEEPIHLHKGTSVISNCSKLQDIGKKSELVPFSCDAEASLGEELSKLIMKPDRSLKLKEDRRIKSTAITSNVSINTSSIEDVPLSVPASAVSTDNCKIKKLPLGIFPPKLPNNRPLALSYVEASGVKPEQGPDNQGSEGSFGTKSSSDKITQKSSPSCIDEEQIHLYIEEMDSNESFCHEVPEKCCDEKTEKGAVNTEVLETNQGLKRARNLENEDFQTEKKLKLDEDWNDNMKQKQKLLEGTITVREFFTLLQVHVLIQRPRQSQLPVKHAVNRASIPEDEILRQYIFHPKLQAYNEDCQALYQIIEQLKLHVADQDKLLVNMHKGLWEVLRTCSDEELKGFGAALNKMKSCFTKKSKVLAHNGKVKLYEKLVQDAKFQYEKLQSRLAKMDELLKEMDSCLLALETETATMNDSELNANYATEEYESKLRHTESELENYRAKEDALQRDKSNVSDQKQQIIAEINQLQENAGSYQELTEKYNFSEWVIKEWNDHQAVFTFLYDSIELTVGLKCPIDNATFSNKYYQIISVNFESLLDETKALPTAKLVHKLIFQFINSQNSWKEKCSTVFHLSQILHDISLVVNRCQLLGEEIEFLNRWGGKFYLLKTEVNDTNSIPLAKFEVELSLSASYPTSPVAFTIQKCIGNLGQEEISVALSSIPVGTNYLKRMVNQISCNLLRCPSAIQKVK